MAKVVVDLTMSLDGCVAGPSGLPEAGIHDWYFSPSQPSRTVIEQLIANTGAIITGRRAHDLAMAAGGYDNDPFQATYFVLTHHAPENPPAGDTAIVFVTDGVESAVKQAKDAAGERDVVVAGGAQAAQQVLAAGLVDEIRIALRPVLMEGGLALFNNLGGRQLQLECTGATWTPEATHLTYRVLNSQQ